MMVQAYLVHRDDGACRTSGSMRVTANTNHHEGMKIDLCANDVLKVYTDCTLQDACRNTSIELQ